MSEWKTDEQGNKYRDVVVKSGRQDVTIREYMGQLTASVGTVDYDKDAPEKIQRVKAAINVAMQEQARQEAEDSKQCPFMFIRNQFKNICKQDGCAVFYGGVCGLSSAVDTPTREIKGLYCPFTLKCREDCRLYINGVCRLMKGLEE